MTYDTAPVIICALERCKYLSHTEKSLLLQQLAKKHKLLKRLLVLMFNHKFLHDASVNINYIGRRITKRLDKADERMEEFISAHEDFDKKLITLPELKKRLYSALRVLTEKERKFYFQLFDRNLFYLDYNDIKEHIFKGKDFKKIYARFCLAHNYQEGWDFKFPVYVEQKIENSLQLKVIATEDKVTVISRSQKNYSGKFTCLEQQVQKYLVDRNLQRIEVDVLLEYPKYNDRLFVPTLESEENNTTFYVTDIVVNNNSKKEPLTRRLKRVGFLVKRLRKINPVKYRSIQGVLVNTEAKLKRIMNTMRKSKRSLFIKEANSIYEKKRSESWVKIINTNLHSIVLKDCEFLIGPFTGQEYIKKLYGVTPNGYYLQISLSSYHSQNHNFIRRLIGKSILVEELEDGQLYFKQSNHIKNDL